MRITRVDNSHNVLEHKTKQMRYTLTHVDVGQIKSRKHQNVLDTLTYLCNDKRHLFSLRGEREYDSRVYEEQLDFGENSRDRRRERTFARKSTIPVAQRNVWFFPREVGERLFTTHVAKEIDLAVTKIRKLARRYASSRKIRDGTETVARDPYLEGEIHLSTFQAEVNRRRLYAEFFVRISNWHDSQDSRFFIDRNGRKELTAQLVMLDRQREFGNRKDTPALVLTTTPDSLKAVVTQARLADFVLKHELLPCEFDESIDDEGERDGSESSKSKGAVKKWVRFASPESCIEEDFEDLDDPDDDGFVDGRLRDGGVGVGGGGRGSDGGEGAVGGEVGCDGDGEGLAANATVA